MIDLMILTTVLITSFCLTFFVLPAIIHKAVKFGISGHDMNKPDNPEVAEMGGMAIVIGVFGSLLLVIALHTFFGYTLSQNEIMVAMLTLAIIMLIGTFDDLFDMRKDVKTILPMFAALPIIAIAAAGSTMISFPFIGNIDFGIFYILILIPLGVTVASNLTNMLAGFNGMEAGMGAVMFGAVAIIAIIRGEMEAALIAVAMLGALLAFLRFNWWPARIFMGDIGTLAIGGALAVAVIIGNFEAVGAVLVIPYLVDFVIKAANKFPSKEWWGELGENGKLYPLGGKVRGFCQLVMKMSNGISEKKLVFLFIFFEVLCALLAIFLYGVIA